MPGIHTDYYAICTVRISDECYGKSEKYTANASITKEVLKDEGWLFKIGETVCPACKPD